jgi:uncharacterized membrane protein YdbT with pleckstrin-like domain
MSYVEKVLQPGETVLARTRLHWFIYLRPLLVILVALVVLGAASYAPSDSQYYVEIAAAVLGIIGLWLLLVAWVRRMSTELAVTDRRVISKAGFLSRSTQEMHREKVESVEVRQSLAGRIFGYGTVFVRGVGSSWEPFSNIADPLTFRSRITAA